MLRNEFKGAPRVSTGRIVDNFFEYIWRIVFRIIRARDGIPIFGDFIVHINVNFRISFGCFDSRYIIFKPATRA
jgi:hypothetical protein